MTTMISPGKKLDQSKRGSNISRHDEGKFEGNEKRRHVFLALFQREPADIPWGLDAGNYLSLSPS